MRYQSANAGRCTSELGTAACCTNCFAWARAAMPAMQLMMHPAAMQPIATYYLSLTQPLHPTLPTAH